MQRNSVPFVAGYTATTRCILRRFCALRVYKNNVTIPFFFVCFFHILFFPPPFFFSSLLSSCRNDKKHHDSTTVDSIRLKIFPRSTRLIVLYRRIVSLIVAFLSTDDSRLSNYNPIDRRPIYPIKLYRSKNIFHQFVS